MRYQVTTLGTLRYFSTQVSGKPVQLVGQIKSLEYILDNSYTVMECDVIVVGMKHIGLFGGGSVCFVIIKVFIYSENNYYTSEIR